MLGLGLGLGLELVFRVRARVSVVRVRMNRIYTNRYVHMARVSIRVSLRVGVRVRVTVRVRVRVRAGFTFRCWGTVCFRLRSLEFVIVCLVLVHLEPILFDASKKEPKDRVAVCVTGKFATLLRNI